MRGQGGGSWVVPISLRVLDLIHGWSAGRRSGGRLDAGESLTHYSSMAGFEQRQSMVLQLYCRMVGVKRESRKGRGACMALWREGARERKRERRRSRDESKRGESLNEERGQTAPFIVDWDIF